MPGLDLQDVISEVDSCVVEDADEDLIHLKAVEKVIEKKSQTKLDKLLNELEFILREKRDQALRLGRVPDFNLPAYRNECIQGLVDKLVVEQPQYESYSAPQPEMK